MQLLSSFLLHIPSLAAAFSSVKVKAGVIGMRTLVSYDKIRIQEDGFDLDLSCMLASRGGI